MTTATTIEPVTYGSPRLKELLDAVGAGALERERTGERPFAAIDLIREARLGALRIPAEAGGGGATLGELFDVVIDLATVDVNVAHILRGHFAHVERHLRLGADARRTVAQLALSGAIVGNAVTELGPATIGDAQWSTRLAADGDGDGYRLNGKKFFTTGTLYADYAEVACGGPDGETVHALVPTDRDGVTIIDDWDGMGQRATGTGTAVFDNVFVHKSETLFSFPPPAGEEPAPMYLSGAFFQLYVTALEVGVMHALRDDAVAHVHQRARSFAWAPSPTAPDDPLLQREIGEIAAAAFAAESSVRAAAETLALAYDAATKGADPHLDLAHEASLQAAAAKVVVDGLAQKAASQIFDVGGASVVRQTYLLDRHWRNIRTLASHNPTTYKAQAIGAYYTRDTRLPGSGYF